MNLRQKHIARPVLLILALGLTACGGSNAAGVRLDPLPVNVAEDCPHPSDVVATVRGHTVADDEVRMGRLGDELLECRAEKRVAVQAYNLTREVIGFEDPMWRAAPRRLTFE